MFTKPSREIALIDASLESVKVLDETNSRQTTGQDFGAAFFP